MKPTSHPRAPYRTSTLTPPPPPRMRWDLRGDPCHPYTTLRDVAWLTLALLLVPLVVLASRGVWEGVTPLVVRGAVVWVALLALWCAVFVVRKPVIESTPAGRR